MNRAELAISGDHERELRLQVPVEQKGLKQRFKTRVWFTGL